MSSRGGKLHSPASFFKNSRRSNLPSSYLTASLALKGRLDFCCAQQPFLALLHPSRFLSPASCLLIHHLLHCTTMKPQPIKSHFHRQKGWEDTLALDSRSECQTCSSRQRHLSPFSRATGDTPGRSISVLPYIRHRFFKTRQARLT